MTPATGVLRWIRGLVVGLAATGLACGAHVVADGAAPSAAALLGLASAATLVGIVLSARRWTFGSLLVVLTGAQVGFHAVFALLPAAPGGAMAGMPAMTGMAGMAGMTGMTGGLPRAPMLAAHLLAAAVTAVLLLRGESWCWWLLDLLGRAGTPLRAGVLPAVDGPRPAWPGSDDRPHTALAEGGLRRRGPPVAAPACL